MERLYIKYALPMLDMDDKRTFRKWCNNYGVPIFCDIGSNKRYVSKKIFEDAMSIPGKVIEHGKFSVTTSIKNSSSYTGAPMENKPLFIPKAKRIRGLGLTTFCYKCSTNAVDRCNEIDGPLSKCPFGGRHRFKVYAFVPGSKNTRKTKVLETTDVDEAIKQAIDFQKEVKESGFKQTIPEAKKTEKNQDVPRLLDDCIERYESWLKNEGVPFHRHKQRSNTHIKDVIRGLKLFNVCFEKKYDVKNLTIDQINDPMVGELIDFLTNEKKFSVRTCNKHLTFYYSFFKWYSREYNPSIINWFEGLNRKKTDPKPKAISQKEYDALLNVIKPETGIKKFEKGKKRKRNMYQPWLVDGIRLGLETGRRREELVTLKYSNIFEEEGQCYIRVEDYKVNRAQNRITEEEKKYIDIPITASLRSLLNELGYEVYKNTENYILAPEIKTSRSRYMCDALSRGFSHYYKQLDTGRDLSFRSLRKAYITSLQIFMGGNAKAITRHADNDVVLKYYTDKQALIKVAQNFSVFSKENNRKKELEKIRSEISNKQIEMEVEK